MPSCAQVAKTACLQMHLFACLDLLQSVLLHSSSLSTTTYYVCDVAGWSIGANAFAVHHIEHAPNFGALNSAATQLHSLPFASEHSHMNALCSYTGPLAKL